MLAGLARQGDAAIPGTRITARIHANAEAIAIPLDAEAMQRTWWNDAVGLRSGRQVDLKTRFVFLQPGARTSVGESVLTAWQRWQRIGCAVCCSSPDKRKISWLQHPKENHQALVNIMCFYIETACYD